MTHNCGEPIVLGLKPWLPWPFNRCRWWTEPVRAERLAALRIGLAAILLLDILLTYMPDLHLFYGGDSLSHQGSRDLFGYRFKAPHWCWSFLRNVVDPLVFRVAIVVWVVATISLLVGFFSRLSAAIVWVISVSFGSVNTFNDNAGDTVRIIALTYLFLGRSGTVWSIDSWLAHWLGRHEGRMARWFGRPPGPVYIYPWTLRLLFIQMTFIYFINGIAKVVGPSWREGNTLYYVLNDLTIARWSYSQFPIPLILTRLMSWSVMIWEVTFPLWMALPWVVYGICMGLRIRSRPAHGLIRVLRQIRAVMLVFGVLFHLGILVLLELGFFGPYMICLYLPLVPWEHWLSVLNPGQRPGLEAFSPKD